MNETLFETNIPEPEPIRLDDLQGQKITGIPGWRVYKWEYVPPATILMTGAVCKETFKSGPRKGSTNWSKRDKKTERTIAVTEAEAETFRLNWEKETGLCHECTGTKQVFQSWHYQTGTKYKPCFRCGATGKAL